MKTRNVVLVVLAILLVPLVIVACGALWWWSSHPLRYKASAVLVIEQINTKQPSLPGQSQPVASEEFYISQYQLIRSRQVAQKLYNEMRMYNWSMFRNAPPNVDHISVVQSWIRVSPIPKTHLVEVWIRGPDPMMAADMVNRVTDAYTEIVKKRRAESSDAGAQARVRVINSAEVPKKGSRFW